MLHGMYICTYDDFRMYSAIPNIDTFVPFCMLMCLYVCVCILLIATCHVLYGTRACVCVCVMILMYDTA